MAQHEGLSGNPGDGNTSFGPWQMHIGGTLPSNVAALGPAAAQQWAWTTDGVNAALASIASYNHGAAVGATGWNAVNRIAEWERSADIPGQAARAWASYAGWVSGIPIALSSFFTTITSGGKKDQVQPDPAGNAIVPVPAQPGTVTIPGTTTTSPATGGATNPQDVRLGDIGPFKVGIPSGLVLGLMGMALLLIGALLFAYGGQFKANVNMIGSSNPQTIIRQPGLKVRS